MPDILVKVKPGCRTEELKIISDHEWHVKIRAKPVDGEANRYLIKFLSEKLGIPKSKINIIKGETARTKIIALSHDLKFP